MEELLIWTIRSQESPLTIHRTGIYQTMTVEHSWYVTCQQGTATEAFIA